MNNAFVRSELMKLLDERLRDEDISEIAYTRLMEVFAKRSDADLARDYRELQENKVPPRQ